MCKPQWWGVLLAVALLVAGLGGASAQTGRRIYVAAGSSQGNGSAAKPFGTITSALASRLRPGDKVLVRPGTYREQIFIKQDGAPSRHITLRSTKRGGAKLRPPAGIYSTVNIRANYITVEGFDVIGGAGHAIDAERVHHSVIRNNIAHDSGGSGISFYLSEFQIIEGNRVFRNAATNPFQTSGISVASNINLSGDRATKGFRTIIRRNISHHNITTTVPQPHTDGNGIIIDWLRNEGIGHPAYRFPTLVEDNLVYRNGAKGIQIFMSDNVTVRNNTAWHNNRDLKNPGTERGEINVADSAANCRVINNIAVADATIHPDNAAFSLSHRSVLARNNIAFGGNPSVVTWNGAAFRQSAGNMTQNPQLQSTGQGRFRPVPGSPAINAGTGQRPPKALDLAGGRRVIGGIDIGAYEFDPARSPSGN